MKLETDFYPEIYVKDHIDLSFLSISTKSTLTLSCKFSGDLQDYFSFQFGGPTGPNLLEPGAWQPGGPTGPNLLEPRAWQPGGPTGPNLLEPRAWQPGGPEN